ncbi:hypothetical protein [Frigoriglobus tundricola]|uniref:hypothetical protein n=1 Tax=Frigoriglobus tundricola TaxID=2774151 RepID=UPI00148EDC63|nr:hypothetical protein [Frigoriglobus tundricola]
MYEMALAKAKTADEMLLMLREIAGVGGRRGVRMSVFGRRVTPELLASELLHGFESGDVAFDAGASAATGTEDAAVLLADRFVELVEAKIAPTRAQLQRLVDRATTVLSRLDEVCQFQENKDAVNLTKSPDAARSDLDQDIVELALLLPRGQVTELESAARRHGMTTGQMLRRVIGELVASQPASTPS